MAKLGESFRLIAGELDPNSLYYESQVSSNNVIITTGGRHVSVYDVSDTQPMNSWTIMTGHALINGTVHDGVGNRYVAIVDNKVLRMWGKDEVSINKSKKVTISKPVHRLVSKGRLEPLIVYTDGSLAWLSSFSEYISSPCLQKGEELHWEEAIMVKDELILMMIAKDGSGRQNATVFAIKEGCESTQGRNFDISDLSTARCHCLRSREAQASFLSLDSSGGLTETYLTGPSFGQTVQLNQIPLHGTSSAICSLGSTQLAVCGARSPNTDTACLGIWDTKFGILQAWKPLPVAPSGKEKVHLHCHGNHVVLVCTKGLYLYSFASRQSTLGAALGKFSISSMQTAQEPNISAVTKLLKQLSDPDMTKTHKQFSQTFNSLMQEMDKEKKTDLLEIQHQVAAVLKRCLSDKTFWPKDEIHLFIKRSMIPSSMMSDLMEALTTRQEVKLMYDSLTLIPDIPEKAIRICLNFVLRAEDSQCEAIVVKEKNKSNKDKAPTDKPCPYGIAKARLIRTILALPFNDVFMAGEVRHVDFQNCLQLLSFMHYTLETNSLGGAEKSKGAISLIKVVDWLNLILDAHFTQMVLSSEAHPILVKLHQTVEEQVQFYNELVGLESILAQIKEKCSLPRKQFPGLYNIHVLHVH